MDNNVVAFPPARTASKGTDTVALRAGLDANRAAQLQAARKQGHVFDSKDQQQAARNLHRVLDEYQRERGIRKRAVAEKAGLSGGGSTDSTKRLYTYTLPENATDKRMGRLAKKPAQYFEIAKALAACSGEHPDAILCRIFEGCSFGTQETTRFDREAERWQSLAYLLEQMVDHVVGATRFDRCWHEICSIPGVYLVRDGSILPDQGMGLHPHRIPLADTVMCSDEVPPIPSVLLARFLQGPPAPGLIALDGGPEEEATYLVWRETRLAIGPSRRIDQVRPLLEIRTVLEAEVPGRGRVAFDNPHTDGSDMVQEAIIGDRRHSVSVGLYEAPEAFGRDGCEHSYFAWQELSPASLRVLLTPGPFDHPETSRRWDRAVNRDPDVHREDLPHSWFLEHEPAFWTHVSIVTGTLERDLQAACEKLVRDIDAHKDVLAALIADQTAATLRRWSQEDGDRE